MKKNIRYVQTEVPPDLYARLLGIARSRGTSLKEQVSTALEEFVKRHHGEIEEDAILALVGSIETDEGNWSQRKDWRP